MPKVRGDLLDVRRLQEGKKVSRKKKPPQTNYQDNDVDHHRPSLEREIEMLREENIRLLGSVNRLRAQLLSQGFTCEQIFENA